MIHKLFKKAGIPTAGIVLSLASFSSFAAGTSYYTAGSFGTLGSDSIATYQGINTDLIPIMMGIILVAAIPGIIKKNAKSAVK